LRRHFETVAHKSVVFRSEVRQKHDCSAGHRGQALSVLQCQKILSETAEGEAQSAEPAEARRALQCRLGLQAGVARNNSVEVKKPTAVRNSKRRPGVRRPRRDRIGVAVNGAL
jgi:hypothetical protein